MAASRSSYAEVRSRTGVITASILLFVMGICGTAGLFGLMGPVLASGEMQLRPFWEHAMWAGGFTAVILAVAIGTYYGARKGTSVAKAMRGTNVSDVDRSLPDGLSRAQERRIDQYTHFVETCAMASGLNYVPQAYVMFDEQGINAFAAGVGRGSAVVGITAGALEHFDDAELEGVVGHEIAHIVQGDTKTSIMTTAICVALLFMAEIGRMFLNISYFSRIAGSSRSGDSNSGKAKGILLALGVGLTVAGFIGVLFGRLVQALISRQAEYRADAAGALYAGTPNGLISALEKIQNVNQPEVGTQSPSWFAHMMLAPPGRLMKTSERLSSLAFGTHPPTEKRIATLGGPSVSAVSDPQ